MTMLEPVSQYFVLPIYSCTCLIVFLLNRVQYTVHVVLSLRRFSIAHPTFGIEHLYLIHQLRNACVSIVSKPANSCFPPFCGDKYDTVGPPCPVTSCRGCVF